MARSARTKGQRKAKSKGLSCSKNSMRERPRHLSCSKNSMREWPRQVGCSKNSMRERPRHLNYSESLRRQENGKVKLRRSIRWQLGTLFVEAARRPWRVVRLPLDLTRLAVVAFSRRYSVSSNNVSTRNPSHPSPPMTENRGNMREARARPGRRTEVPTATSLLSPGSSSKQMVDWITDQVEGHRVAVVGCDNTALLESLDQLRFNVRTYQLDSSVSEPVLVKREVGDGSQEEPGRSLVIEYS